MFNLNINVNADDTRDFPNILEKIIEDLNKGNTGKGIVKENSYRGSERIGQWVISDLDEDNGHTTNIDLF